CPVVSFCCTLTIRCTLVSVLCVSSEAGTNSHLPSVSESHLGQNVLSGSKSSALRMKVERSSTPFSPHRSHRALGPRALSASLHLSASVGVIRPLACREFAV